MAESPLDRLLSKAKAFTQSETPTDHESIADRNYQGEVAEGSGLSPAGLYADPPERPLPRPMPDFQMEPWFTLDEPDSSKRSPQHVIDRIVRATFGLGSLVAILGGLAWGMSIAVSIFAE